MTEYVYRNTTSIGNLDAETDSFLTECFIENEAYKILESFTDLANKTKRILVGRTGSGKTAILRILKQQAALCDQTEVAAETTVFEYIKNNKFIAELLNNSVDLKIFFKVLWNHVILVKILTLLKENQSFWDKLTSKNKDMVDYVNKYRDIFFTDDALSKITEKFQDELEGVVSSRFVKLRGLHNEEIINEVQRTTNSYVNKELLSQQRKIIDYLHSSFRWDKQKKIFITIDDLDKSWLTDLTIKFSFIDSLLESIKDFLKLDNLKIIISIRTDILEGVYKNNFRQEEKDLSLMLPIEWTRDEIKALLNKRISHLLKDKYRTARLPTFDDIFDFSLKGQKAVDYLLDRTMLRPRDAIDFVNRCFHAADGHTYITADNVINAEEYFFTSRKNALVDEWKALYPAIEKYINVILKFVYYQSFRSTDVDNDKAQEEIISCEEISDEIVQKSLNNKNIVEDLLQVLFEIGVIGIKLSNNNIIYSNFNKRHLDISDFNKEFYVHPLFWRK